MFGKLNGISEVSLNLCLLVTRSCRLSFDALRLTAYRLASTGDTAKALLEFETLSGDDITQLLANGKLDRPDTPAGLIAPGRLESLSLATREGVAPPSIGAPCPVALLASDGEGRIAISLSGA